jgi:hypothetical protein
VTVIPLAEPTGHPVLDRVLAGVVGVGETVAPGRVHSYYLVGSHADRSALPGSDLDVLALLRPGLADRTRAGLRDVFRCLGHASEVPVDVILADRARSERCG